MSQIQVKSTDKRECEVCNYIAPEHPKVEEQCKVYGSIVMCPACLEKELKLSSEVVETAENRVNQMRLNEVIEMSRKVDEKIQVKADLFNAHTVAILELKAAIEQDDNIPRERKMYVLVEELVRRYEHDEPIIFSKREEINNLENAQRARLANIQTFALQLSKEEKERLHIQNINYTPAPPKVVKPRETKPTKKLQLGEVKKFAAQYSVPMDMVQTLVVAKNLSPEDAAKLAKKMLG